MKLKIFPFLIICLFLPLVLLSQQQGMNNIDSAKRITYRYKKADSIFIKTSFYIADEYMNRNMYDSAQIWLNNIALRLPLRKPSFFNFYLSINQAETYYYNGLKQMYLQESERALRIAESIHDSIMLATANNFVGLGNMGIDSIAKGIRYLKMGIPYAKQPPYPEEYLSASKPHHLYGNLAEAYYKLGIYDSAAIAAFTAKNFAKEIPWPRGIAVADNMLGLIYARLNKYDSAIAFQKEAIAIGLVKDQVDVSLVSYAAEADCFQLLGQDDSAISILGKGMLLLKENPSINNNFANQFLEDAIQLYKKLKQEKLLIVAMEMKSTLTAQLVKQNDAQITTLVKGSVANELRAANLELTEAKQKQALSNTRFIIALLTIISMIVLFFVYRYYHKKQLKEIEIRNKISRDLHDDIGATLSSIHIYGELANTVLEKKPDHSKEIIGKMTTQAKDLMGRMGDVIWSMKPAADEKYSFTTRLKNYSSELLLPKEITCDFDIDETVIKKISDPIVRKNILLIAKEAMNNIAKYSSATNASISMQQLNDTVILIIKDNGKGFENTTALNGNGLNNMKQRCEQLKGTCKYQSEAGNGVCITCTFPIAIFSYKQ